MSVYRHVSLNLSLYMQRSYPFTHRLTPNEYTSPPKPKTYPQVKTKMKSTRDVLTADISVCNPFTPPNTLHIYPC